MIFFTIIIIAVIFFERSVTEFWQLLSSLTFYQIVLALDRHRFCSVGHYKSEKVTVIVMLRRGDSMALPVHCYRLNWNLECWFFAEGGKLNRRIRRKTLGARTITNNKLNLYVTPGTGIQPESR